MFILGFIQFTPTLAIYDIVHSLPLGGEDMDFPFSDDKIRKHSHTSLVLREHISTSANSTPTTAKNDQNRSQFYWGHQKLKMVHIKEVSAEMKVMLVFLLSYY